MSGVFGIVDPSQRLDRHQTASRMAAGLRHRDWYQIEWLNEPAQAVVLGRVGIGIFNSASQPLWNSDRSIALVMAGELYAVDGVETRAPGAISDEARLLQLYEQSGGTDFARRLNGVFVVACLDLRRRQLVIANDRFGLYPLYYSTANGRLVFAPEVKGVLADPGLARRLDLTALAQYMRFQHLLGERTFFEGVTQLPPATTLICDLATAACRREAYWSFADLPAPPQIEFQEAVGEAGRLLRQATVRASEDRYRPGVYLSGGLDSRILLGLTQRRPVASVTYGARNSRDVFYAARIAHVVGSEHHWFDLGDGAWVKEYADLHLDLTEGFHSWIHAHGISTLAAARGFMDVNLSGWDGGTLFGDSITVDPALTAAVDDSALLTALFQRYNQAYTWPGLTEAEERFLYTAALWPQVRGLALDSLREEFTPYRGLRRDLKADLFYVRQHCLRLTQNMITFYRSHLEVRFPFFDYALFDFMYSLPMALKGDKVLYRAVLQQETPALARIPYDHDEFLPTTQRWLREAHAVALKLGRRARRYWGGRERPTLYADYERYLREELRPWAEAILFDPRTEARGLFQASFLRTLMARHGSGQEQWTIGKIAPLITYEMMLRRLVD